MIKHRTAQHPNLDEHPAPHHPDRGAHLRPAQPHALPGRDQVRLPGQLHLPGDRGAVPGRVDGQGGGQAALQVPGRGVVRGLLQEDPAGAHRDGAEAGGSGHRGPSGGAQVRLRIPPQEANVRGAVRQDTATYHNPGNILHIVVYYERLTTIKQID